MMDFAKRVFEIENCNDHRPLFYPGFVDDMCHLGFMLIRSEELRHENFLNAIFNIQLADRNANMESRKHEVVIFRGVCS